MTQPPNDSRTALLTQKDYAERKGWSKQYVNQLVRQGRISLIDGKIDPVAADVALASSRDPSHSVRAPRVSDPTNGREGSSPPPQHTYTKVRTLREHYRTMREKLDYEAAANKVVSREEVSTALTTAARHLRDAALNLAPGLAAELSSRLGIDGREVQVIAEEYVRKWLQLLAEKFSAEAVGLDSQSSIPNEPQAI